MKEIAGVLKLAKKLWNFTSTTSWKRSSQEQRRSGLFALKRGLISINPESYLLARVA